MPSTPAGAAPASTAPDDERRSLPGGSEHGLFPGLAVATAGVAAALLLHAAVPAVGPLTWAVGFGVAVANCGLLPGSARPGLRLVTRRLLRVGVVLLGFSLSVVSMAALGLPVIALVVATLLATLLITTWLGRRMGLGRPRSLLIGTGFAICGASAIAAMEENAEADEDDVATAVAMVTICGTVAMVALPLLQAPLGLSSEQLGMWAGASVHEVGQVVAAASPAGATAVGVAIVVKLTRVLMLAPVVAGVSMLRRREMNRAARSGHHPRSERARLPAVVPPFVLLFLACVVVRSTGAVPAGALTVIEQLQTATLAAALFGMGTGVHLRSLVCHSRGALALSAVSTLVVAGVSLAGIRLLG